MFPRSGIILYICHPNTVIMKEQDNETAWLRKLGEGDNGAYERLFSMFYAALCSFAESYLEDRDAAEDVVQDVFFKLYTERPSFETTAGLKSYLYLAAKNRCLNVLKHRRVEEEYAKEQEKEGTTFFFNQIVEQELLQLLREAVGELPEQTGKVLELVMEGLDNAEIAERLRLTMDAVKSHKKRGRQLLKKRLDDIVMILAILSGC